ncbi:hypothetical protein LCGC14_2880330, partial [marine sediment metagenome]
KLTGQVAFLNNGSVQGCYTGVEVTGDGYHQVQNIQASGNINGFLIVSSNNSLTDNTSNYNGNGFSFDPVSGTQNTSLTNNTGSNNGSSGFDVRGSNHTFTKNTADYNLSTGFDVLGSDHTFHKNTVNYNTFDGFHVTGENHTFTKNTVNDNFADGFEVSGDNHTLIKNIADGNGQSGIEVRGSLHTFSKNTANNNIEFGIDVKNGATDNTLEKNKAFGSGFEDLVDMGGEGTRVIATEQEIILFSTREVWRGRRIGGEFVFQYSPITRKVGAPFARAVLNTTQGIFWLGSDFNIWRYLGGQISPIANDIQRTLRDTAQNLDTAFFSYNEELQHLTLYYATTPTALPDRAFTRHIKDGAWTPQQIPFTVSQALAFNVPSSATTWGGLIGDL